jgi:large subunit ribosomal protein L5
MAKSKTETKVSKKGASRPTGPTGPSAPLPEGYVPRLKQRYQEEIVPRLQKEFGIDNLMAVPRIEKIALNMGVGEAIQNIKILDDAVEELTALAGQRPVITRAQKSIAAFSVALPRVRDFRGISAKSFDGRGNYTLGVRDQLIFPEIDYNKVEKAKGMNITIVTTAGNDERALFLLRALGMPFQR